MTASHTSRLSAEVMDREPVLLSPNLAVPSAEAPRHLFASAGGLVRSQLPSTWLHNCAIFSVRRNEFLGAIRFVMLFSSACTEPFLDLVHQRMRQTELAQTTEKLTDDVLP